jgi:hypothetical protein
LLPGIILYDGWYTEVTDALKPPQKYKNEGILSQVKTIGNPELTVSYL